MKAYNLKQQLNYNLIKNKSKICRINKDKIMMIMYQVIKYSNNKSNNYRVKLIRRLKNMQAIIRLKLLMDMYLKARVS